MKPKELFAVLLLTNAISIASIYFIEKHTAARSLGRRSLSRSDDTAPHSSKLHYLKYMFHNNNSMKTEMWKRNSFLLEPTYDVNDVCHNECTDAKAVRWKMVLFVKSAIENNARRELVRRTWGRIGFVGGGVFNTVFVIGKKDNRNIQNLLIEEHSRYGDLLQYDGPDSYQNISKKTLAGMEWASLNLEENSLYSSVDDDFMINVVALQEQIDINFEKMKEINWPDFPLYCGFAKGENEKPIREGALPHQKKWILSRNIYKWTTLPTYCHGGLYTTSLKVVKQLLEVAKKEDVFHLDDMWITGILRQKLGMPASMVVDSPGIEPGLHYIGYQGKERESARNFMKSEWAEIFNKFRRKNNFCNCFK